MARLLTLLNPSAGADVNNSSANLSCQYTGYYDDLFNSGIYDSARWYSTKLKIKPDETIVPSTIPSWNQDMYMRTIDNDTPQLLSNTVDPTKAVQYRSNFPGTINIPYGDAIQPHIDIPSSGTYKMVAPLSVDGTYKLIRWYGGAYTRVVNIGQCKLYTSDGWSGTINEASLAGKISPLSFIFSGDHGHDTLLYIWNIDTFFDGGMTTCPYPSQSDPQYGADFPILHLFIKPLVNITHVEFYTNSSFSTNPSYSDGFHINQTDIEEIAPTYADCLPNYSFGKRTSNPIALLGSGSTLIKWTEDKPINTNIVVKCAITSDTTMPADVSFLECTNNGQIPGIEPTTDMTGKYLWIRQELSTTESSKSPRLLKVEYATSAIISYTLTMEIDSVATFNTPNKKSTTFNITSLDQTVNWDTPTLTPGIWYWRASINDGLTPTSEIRSLNEIVGSVKRGLYQYENVGIQDMSTMWTNKRALYQYENVIMSLVTRRRIAQFI